ncbi:MAG: hypothetical protein NTAFB01_35500 [Nitrospira sp.]
MAVCPGLAARLDVGSLSVLNLIDMDERCLPVKKYLRDTGVCEETERHMVAGSILRWVANVTAVHA